MEGQYGHRMRIMNSIAYDNDGLASSALVNAGTNVGAPYNGSAPDIGAFEN